jgi:glycosyltransferase involved in cell wall biosynthesis
MRITFVTSKINFERAGGSVPDFDLKVRDMQARGAAVHAVTLFSEGNLLTDLPYPVSEESIQGKKSLFNINHRAFQVLRKYSDQTDVFHVEGQFVYGAALYRLLGGKPVVLFYNREMLVWEKKMTLRRIVRRAFERVLYKLLVPHIDHCYFTTPQLRDCYIDFGLTLPKGRMSTILDFFDPDSIRSHAASRTHRTAKLQIFASGRMIPEKGFALFIESLVRLPQDIRERIQVTLGGDGPERDRLQKIVRERGLDMMTTLPGWVDRNAFWELLSEADIFVLPRWRIEQPSVVVMEALSLGIPTIAPGGGGVEWMAQNAFASFKDGDVGSLAAALERVISSEEERTRLSAAAAKRVDNIQHSALAPALWNIFQKFV